MAIVEPGIQNTEMAQQLADAGSASYRQPRRFAGLFRAALANPVPPEVPDVFRNHTDRPEKKMFIDVDENTDTLRWELGKSAPAGVCLDRVATLA